MFPVKLGCLLFLFFLVLPVSGMQENAPRFYLGVDLSYVNEMEDCGAVYLKDGTPQDPFVILQAQGASLVRARLWHTPDWTTYSTLEDVIKTFGRAKQQGMATLLAVHYSDNWADPGRQEIPAAWVSLDEPQLVGAVYQYTYEVLVTLDEAGLVPDFIQVGNETNSGLLKQAVGLDWPRDAALFNAGIQAIRDFSAAAGHHPQIVLHVAQPENTGWWFREAESAGVTDFDVIGVSYYPQWSTFSIADMGAQVSYLRQQFGKEVMVVEAAYPWTREAVDETADNILNQGRRGYPITLEGQRQFMIDLTQSLISNGALGIVYWEPAWVSTSCFTRWGQGSHWENAALFDFQQELHAGADFLNHDYLYPAEIVDGEIEAGYGDPLVEDGTADVLENSAALDLAALYAYKQDEALYLAITVNGSILAERGNYLIYLDTTHNTEGASIDVGSRPITAADPFKPEFRLDIGIVEEKTTVSGSYTLNAWIDGEWQPITFTGGASILSGDTSVIEIQIPLTLINTPEVINITMLSTGRSRNRTAADILGTDFVPAAWTEAVVLDSFFPVE